MLFIIYQVYHLGPKPKSEASLKQSHSSMQTQSLVILTTKASIRSIELELRAVSFLSKALHEALLCKTGVFGTLGINNSFLLFKRPNTKQILRKMIKKLRIKRFLIAC